MILRQLVSIMFTVLLAGFSLAAAPDHSVTAGGPTKAFRLPVGALPEGELIEVRLDHPGHAVHVRLQVALRFGQAFKEVETFRVGTETELFLLVNAPSDVQIDRLEGGVLFSQAGVPLARAPFEINIQKPSTPLLFAALGGIGVAALGFILAGALLNTRLLPSPRKLAAHFRPIHRRRGQITSAIDERHRDNVAAELRSALSPGNRWRNWLRANPLKFVLPGRLYREALQLYPTVKGGRGLNPTLLSHHDLPKKLQQAPHSIRSGHIFAIATSWKGTELIVYPDRHHRVGHLTIEHANHRSWFRLEKTQEFLQKDTGTADRRLGLKIHP